MSNYSKSTNFASKDSLATGNPLKVIKGTEIDDEFEAIETSIGTKADTASPTFTGTPAAPTAALGTSTTQLATTAFVTNAVNAIDLTVLYPVGSIYTNASSSTNPATLLGFGTWSAFGAGRVLVGIDSSDSDFDTAEETGGAKTHTLTIDEMPSHTHDITTNWTDVNGYTVIRTGDPQNDDITFQTEATGGGDPHNNLQPYITVYMWKRIA